MDDYKLKLIRDYIKLNQDKWGFKSYTIDQILTEFLKYWERENRKIK